MLIGILLRFMTCFCHPCQTQSEISEKNQNKQVLFCPIRISRAVFSPCFFIFKANFQSNQVAIPVFQAFFRVFKVHRIPGFQGAFPGFFSKNAGDLNQAKVEFLFKFFWTIPLQQASILTRLEKSKAKEEISLPQESSSSIFHRRRSPYKV